MTIHCVSFGTLWWLDRHIDRITGCLVPERSCFKCTTGFRNGNKDVWNSKTKGILRLNVATHRNVVTSSDVLQGRFDSAGIAEYQLTNRLLLGRRLDNTVPIDAHLVTVRSEECGHIDFRSDWKTGRVRLFSSSFNHRTNDQETMLLMPSAATIRTTLGEWGILWNSRLAYLGLV